LAINIKSDGLHTLVCQALKEYRISNYFLFDMSVPDSLGYLKMKAKVFTRESEFEIVPCFYREAAGVWMDEFSRHWITAEKIRKHLNNGKKICIVSPELHGRKQVSVWREYRKLIKQKDSDQIMLCTDFPEEARRFFYE